MKKENLPYVQTLLKELDSVITLRNVLRRKVDSPVYIQAPYTTLGGVDLLTEKVTIPHEPILDALDTHKDALEAELWHLGLTFDKAPVKGLFYLGIIMNEPTIKLGWVRGSILERNKGLGPRILEKCRQRGQFIEGTHWKKAYGVIIYHYERIDQLYEELDVA